MLKFSGCLVKPPLKLGQGLAWLVNTSYINSFIIFFIFPIYQNNENTGYLYDITFIYDRCHHVWAAETPDKYEHY